MPMKIIATALSILFSVCALAAPSPDEQLSKGKSYYYGTDRAQNSGFACFWLLSAAEAGADSYAFIEPACDDAEVNGYDISYLKDVVRKYQRSGKEPTEDQLVPQSIQTYDRMPVSGAPVVVADMPVQKFNVTNTTYKESDAESRVPYEDPMFPMETPQQYVAQQPPQQYDTSGAPVVKGRGAVLIGSSDPSIEDIYSKDTEKRIKAKRLYRAQKELEDDPLDPDLSGRSYSIEYASDKILIINGETFKPKIYCLGWMQGDRVKFIEGSAYGACAMAKIYNQNRKESCEVWCKQ